MDHISSVVLINTLVIFGTTTCFFIFYTLIKYLILIFGHGKFEVEINKQTMKIRKNPRLIGAARCAYVELYHRKINIKFNDKYDLISDIFASFYLLFPLIREILKDLHCEKGAEGKLFQYLSNFIINDLQNLLTQYQKDYYQWLEKEKKSENYISEIISQNKYKKYNEIIDSLNKLNKKTNNLCNVLKKIGYN